MPTPAADLGVDAALVRRLLDEQCPDLAGLPLRLVANGWDNAVFRLGPDLAVRVPRRLAAAELVRHEQEALPAIAERVPVPAPVRVGTPGPAYPFAWSVVPWFEGRTVAEAGVRDDVGLAGSLAGFLRALHVPASGSVPANPARGVPLAARAPDVASRLASDAVPRAEALRAVWADALAAAPWSGPPVWLHGDLHPANLLVSDGRLAAVLDFGDVTAGDPATDLATGWLTLGAVGRAVLREGLAPDGDTWRRARGWALVMATAMVVSAEPGSTLAVVGARTLDEVLADAG